MNQKVVFLDVDGTIVNDKGIIPESAQIAIRKAVENGHKLVVCSGRSLFQLPADAIGSWIQWNGYGSRSTGDRRWKRNLSCCH